MESIIFLTEQLNQIYNLHPYLEIQYEFRSHINTHIIEVKPVHCFESDKQYIDLQINLEASFEEIFYNEEILFITENALIQIENPILKLGVSELIVHDGLCIEENSFNFSTSIWFEELEEKTSFISPSTELEQYNVYDFNKMNLESNFIKTLLIHKLPNKLNNILKKRKKDPEIKSGSFFFINIAT